MDTARLVRKPFVSKRGSKRLVRDGGQNTFCERGVVIRIGRAYLLRGSTLTSRSRRGVSFGRSGVEAARIYAGVTDPTASFKKSVPAKTFHGTMEF